MLNNRSKVNRIDDLEYVLMDLALSSFLLCIKSSLPQCFKGWQLMNAIFSVLLGVDAHPHTHNSNR
jgi:hypothetical protein